MKKYLHIVLIGLLSALTLFIARDIMRFFLIRLDIVSFLIEALLVCTIFIIHIGLGYFYAKNKSIFPQWKEIIFFMLFSILFADIIIPVVLASIRFSQINWSFLSAGVHIYQVTTFGLILLIFLTITGLFGFKYGIKITSDSYASGQELNKVHINYIIIIISYIIGIGTCLLSSFGFFTYGMVTSLLIPIIIFLISLISTLLFSFYARRYYDRKTATISQLGLIFTLLPPAVFILLCIILLYHLGL